MRSVSAIVTLAAVCSGFATVSEAGPRAVYRRAYQAAWQGQQVQLNAAANGELLRFLLANGIPVARDVLSQTNQGDGSSSIATRATSLGPSENDETLKAIQKDLAEIKKALRISTVSTPPAPTPPPVQPDGAGAAGGSNFTPPPGPFPGFPR